jgi:hypothetical protein
MNPLPPVVGFSSSRRFVRRLATAVALSLAVASTFGQVAVSNLTETKHGSVNVTTTAWWASSFTTHSETSYTLNSVSLKLSAASNTAGNFFVRLYSNGSGVPGSSLETLSGTGNPSSATTYSFTSGGTTLNQGTTYWLVAGVTSGAGDYSWDWTNSTAQDSVEGQSWGIGNDDVHTSSNSGSTWVFDGAAMQFSVTATAIPEPGTYAAIFGVAALGLVAWRRRKVAPAA